MLKLRGHHLLCMQFFQGYGYSSKFTEKMQDIINIINDNDELSLRLTSSCDSICAHCPWQKNNNCKKYNKKELIEKDRKILALLTTTEDKQVKSGILKKKIIKMMKTINLADLCSNCPWYFLCNKSNNSSKVETLK